MYKNQERVKTGLDPKNKDYETLVNNAMGGAIYFSSQYTTGIGPFVLEKAKSITEAVTVGGTIGGIAGTIYTLPGMVIENVFNISDRISEKLKIDGDIKDYLRDLTSFVTGYTAWTIFATFASAITGDDPYTQISKYPKEILGLSPIPILGTTVNKTAKKIIENFRKVV